MGSTIQDPSQRHQNCITTSNMEWQNVILAKCLIKWILTYCKNLPNPIWKIDLLQRKLMKVIPLFS